MGIGSHLGMNGPCQGTHLYETSWKHTNVTSQGKEPFETCPEANTRLVPLEYNWNPLMASKDRKRSRTHQWADREMRTMGKLGDQAGLSLHSLSLSLAFYLPAGPTPIHTLSLASGDTFEYICTLALFFSFSLVSTMNGVKLKHSSYVYNFLFLERTSN